MAAGQMAAATQIFQIPSAIYIDADVPGTETNGKRGEKRKK